MAGHHEALISAFPHFQECRHHKLLASLGVVEAPNSIVRWTRTQINHWFGGVVGYHACLTSTRCWTQEVPGSSPGRIMNLFFCVFLYEIFILTFFSVLFPFLVILVPLSSSSKSYCLPVWEHFNSHSVNTKIENALFML